MPVWSEWSWLLPAEGDFLARDLRGVPRRLQDRARRALDRPEESDMRSRCDGNGHYQHRMLPGIA